MQGGSHQDRPEPLETLKKAAGSAIASNWVAARAVERRVVSKGIETGRLEKPSWFHLGLETAGLWKNKPPGRVQPTVVL